MSLHNRIPVKDESPQIVNLYAKREKIHTRLISGKFQDIRNIFLWLTTGFYFILPWIMWNDRQAILFDLPARKFYILGWTFYPQDFFFLSWILIISAFCLFAITVFVGRVYCGYLCPQTVWTKIFMHIEKWTEGERNARTKLDSAKLSINKIIRRTLKHIGWLIVALLTAVTFVSFFTPTAVLFQEFLSLSLGPWELFWIIFFTLATYANAGWMREQVCFYMCPYGRFQSVMMDKDTLIISYDEKRGDPRGSRKRDVDYKEQGLGDCIDCQLCVQVCPTGIDIRDGLQFECIQCAACVDACDSIMDQMGYERGLVSYTTENIASHGGKFTLLRTRLIGYAIMIFIMSGIFITVLALRVPLEVETIRDRGQLFRENNEGMIENAYLLKVMNKSQESDQFRLEVIGDAHIKLVKPILLDIPAGGQAETPVTLIADPAFLTATKYDLIFKVVSLKHTNLSKENETRFLGPRQ